MGGCGVERDADDSTGRVHGAGAGDDRPATEGAHRPFLPGALGARRPSAQRHLQPVLNARAGRAHMDQILGLDGAR